MSLSSHRSLLFLAVLLLSLGAFELVSVDRFGVKDYCLSDRSDPTTIRPSSTTSFLLFYTTCVFLGLGFISLAFLVDGKLSYLALYYCSLAVAWYMTVYPVLVLLKDAIGDFSCSQHANSVSGHFNFHLYYVATLPYISSLLLAYVHPISSDFRARFGVQVGVIEGSRGSRVLLQRLLRLVVIVTSIATLSRTYLYGYHSLLQIVYGSLFGLISHLVFVLVTSVSRDVKSQELTRPVNLLTLTSYVAAVGVVVGFVHVYLGKPSPYSSIEGALHLLNVAFSFFTASVVARQ